MRRELVLFGAVAVLIVAAFGIADALGAGTTSGIDNVSVGLTGTRTAGSTTETYFLKGGVCYRTAQETWTGTADGNYPSLTGNFTMTLNSLDRVVPMSTPSGAVYVPQSGRSTGTITVNDQEGGVSSYKVQSVDTLNGNGLFTEGFISGNTKPPTGGANTITVGPFFANFAAMISDPDHFTGSIGSPISGQPENSGIILVRVGAPTAKQCPAP